jgi:hypothetical protein
MLGDPRLAIIEFLGEGYFIKFQWTNYGCRNGKVWDLTKKQHMSFLL